jgi:hypothetical protein
MCLVGTGSPTFFGAEYPMGGSLIQVTGPGTGLLIESPTQASTDSQVRNVVFTEASYRSIAASITVANPCMVTLVWTFDAFVRNSTGNTPN